MDNNDCLRRLRYILDLDDNAMVHIFSLADHASTRVEICNMLKKEDDTDYLECTDSTFTAFLDGLIIEKRGPRPDGSTPEPQQRISRNEVLKKLRIALNLREDGMLAVFKHADFVVTKAELGSFFRKEGQRNFAECPEQVLRKFIHGLGQEAR